mgnify:CR=1 FL=1
MMVIFNFLNKKEISKVTQYIRETKKEMSFSMDFILDGKNILLDSKSKKDFKRDFISCNNLMKKLEEKEFKISRYL